MPEILYLVRHCESCGQCSDAPLTQAGFAQAGVLASFFGGLGVELLVSSACTRALQSILPLFPDSDWTFGLNAWENLSNPDVFNLVQRTAEVAISRVWNEDRR